MSPAAAVTARGLAHRYGDLVALEDLDFDFGRGCLVGLVGANGAGKSTLLQLLAGRLTVQAGTLRAFGQPPGAATRDRISFTRQRPALDPEMTVRQTVRYWASLIASSPADGARVLRRLELAEHLGRPVAALSGGLRQRLHLALDLLRDAPLQLFDEPTAALDRNGHRKLWNLLAERAQKGATVVVASHDLEALEGRADQVMVLHRGKLKAHEDPRDLGRRIGCPTLAARLRAEIPAAAEIRHQLETIPGVAFADLARQRLVLALRAEADVGTVEGQLMSRLEQHRLEVAEVVRRPPDLLSAVLNLSQRAESPQVTR
ncbi:MAG: ABC transporter ATP-binding protein [Acidobacteriota bacterium]